MMLLGVISLSWASLLEMDVYRDMGRQAWLFLSSSICVLVFVEVLHLIFFQPVVIAFMSMLDGDPHLVLW